MSAEISPDNERYLHEVVERGVYRDRAAAIDEAVELLKRRDRLRSEIQLGIDQADRGELIEADEVFRRVEARAREIASKAREQA